MAGTTSVGCDLSDAKIVVKLPHQRGSYDKLTAVVGRMAPGFAPGHSGSGRFA
jgi:hypothetical protein